MQSQAPGTMPGGEHSPCWFGRKTLLGLNGLLFVALSPRWLGPADVGNP